jgi:molecular chaperone GrpE
MINDQLFDILAKDGLKEINTKDQKFDPKIHKAIETVVNNDVEENICVEEVQKGYMYKDRVLRCASVKVSKKEEK